MPRLWGVWVRVPLGALAGLSGLALRKLNTLMCPWWNFGRHARFRLWCPLRRVGSSPTGRTGGGGFLHFLLPLALRSCYSVSECGSPGWLNW